MPSPVLRMKDSGVESVGQIPEHWEIRKLGTLGTFFKGRGIAKSDITESGLPAITYGDLYTRYGIEAKVLGKFIPPEVASNAQEIRNGNLLFAASGETIEDIGKTTLYSGNVPGYAGGDVIVLRVNQGNGLFLSYVLNCDVGIQQKSVFGRGDIIVHISASSLKQVTIPYPPQDEARRIASFLDRKTSLIDDLIAKRERQIELLQEHRTTLISLVVTKGLNPDVPMKDSGVEWIGQIPANWKTRPTWTLFRLGRGRVISHEEIAANPGPYPVFSSQTANDGVMGNMGTYDFEGNCLTWTTDGANAGTVFKRSGRFNCTNVCGTLFPMQELHLGFFHHVIDRATNWFVRHDINPKLMNNVMSNIRVQEPPCEEQRTIAEYLDRETTKIDTFVAKVRSGIEKIKEYRQSLISAAVTGKIDMRNWAQTSEPAEETLHA